jgi:Class II Aldolase and Adducin N-terminal domain
VATAHDYSRPLRPDEVVVCVVDPNRRFPSLHEDVSVAGERYCFSVLHVEDQTTPLNLGGRLVRHAIIVDGLDDPRAAYDRHSEFLKAFSSATLAVSYSSVAAFLGSSDEVERLKAETGGRVNFLRPSAESGQYRPALAKLVDNSVCDSVRIKYRPKRRSGDLTSLLGQEHLEFFRQCSRLYREHAMYHRAPTDGFFSVRLSGSSFFITATKTNKAGFDPRRISLVHRYDPETNELEYSGAFLPSSDSVEASLLFTNVPWIGAVLHSHASERFTRNPRYAHKVAVPPMSYGDAELGRRLVDYLKPRPGHDFLIMEDHGELFLSSDGPLSGRLAQIEHTINSNQL